MALLYPLSFVCPAGGLYIVEDIETSYWGRHASLYGYTYRDQQSAVDRLKMVVDTVNRKTSCALLASL